MVRLQYCSEHFDVYAFYLFVMEVKNMFDISVFMEKFRKIDWTLEYDYQTLNHFVSKIILYFK